MKKILILCLVMFSAHSVSASGKLVTQLNAWDGGENVRPVFGLAVYQKLMSVGKTTFAANTYAGVGQHPLDESPDVTWAVAKAQLDASHGRFVLSPGVQVNYAKPFNEARSLGFVRLSYQLW